MKQPILNGVLESPLDLNGFGFVNIGGLLGTFQLHAAALDALAATSPSFAGLHILQLASPGVNSLLSIASNGTPGYTAITALEPSLGNPGVNGYVLSSTTLGVRSWVPNGTGTVTSVSIITANGISGSVANPTTTPAITLSLGAITPSSVAASGTVTGSNLSGTNTGDQIVPVNTTATSHQFFTAYNSATGAFTKAALIAGDIPDLSATYQPASSNLTTYAGIAPSANAQTLLGHTFSQIRTDLGLVIGTNVQAWNANLDTWATKTPYAGTVTITTGKTFSATGTLTLTGTDGSTLNIGTGGTLGTNAYTSTAYEPALGNPGTSGFVLSSTTGGVRSWVSMTNAFPDISDTAGVVSVGQPTGYGVFNGGSGLVSLGDVLLDGNSTRILINDPSKLVQIFGKIDIRGNRSSAAWTTSGISLTSTASTLTDTTSSGTVAAAYTNRLGGNTIAASSATTFTNYISSYFSEPTAGTNVTLTNKWGLGADSLYVGTSNPVKITSAGVLTATSPVFTTPDIGTPSAGIATNLTSIPAANLLIASQAVGDILYASSASAWERLADVATGNVLLSGGVTTAPAWGKVTIFHTTGIAASGAIGSSGLTMGTAKILGRSTAGTGAIEELSRIPNGSNTLGAQFYDNTVTPLLSVNFGTRQSIANDGTTAMIDWSNPDHITFVGGITLSGDGSMSVQLRDGSLLSIDPFNRMLYSNDGSTVALNWTDPTKLQFFDGSSYISNTGVFTGDASGLTNLPGGHAIAGYADGTVYTLTNSDALVHFGTTDPTITIDQAGTYLIFGRAYLKYNGATYASTQSARVHLRRTNNTAEDISNATTTATMRVITTITDSVGIMSLPGVIYTTTNTDDVISVYGSLSATPAAGSVQCTEASIVAIRLY
jgi:hypothetical protein